MHAFAAAAAALIVLLCYSYLGENGQRAQAHIQHLIELETGQAAIRWPYNGTLERVRIFVLVMTGRRYGTLDRNSKSSVHIQ